MTKHMPYLLLAVALLTVTAALAQETGPAPLTGTVTFRSGQTLTGIIKAADLGIMDGTGVGTNLSGNGAIKISVNGQPQRVPAANIASVEATWVDKSTAEEPGWEISELKLVTKDGQTLVGKPGWHMHATNVSIQLASGETKRVHAFPLAGPDFKPENLIAKIDLTGAAPAATIAPATTTPATTEPATTGPDLTVTPATTTPATTEAPATTAVVAPAAAPGPMPVPANAVPVAMKAGQTACIEITIPDTKKKVVILIYTTVIDGAVVVTPAP